MDNELKILLIIAGVIIFYFMITSNTHSKSKENMEDISQHHISDDDKNNETLKNDNNLQYTYDEESMYLLDDGSNGNAGLHYNNCSQSCCSQQYPLPFSLTNDEHDININHDYVPSNMTCMNASQNAGCMCLTKHQAQFLSSRGGNA
jgi:hypothetical protein